MGELTRVGAPLAALLAAVLLWQDAHWAQAVEAWAWWTLTIVCVAIGTETEL